uniref:Hypothetical conserved protein n=1 Tax=uncultured Acetothermia bacterium TaxID=236499 RepID=H5SH22_9BACT|nr:hypothetical conserved protein [uncultured Acetothermia bacterium]
MKVSYPKLSQAEVITQLRAKLPALAEQLPLVRVVLFGSYAQGNYTVGSDIDILVVYTGPQRPDAYALVKRTLGLPKLEPHLYTQAEYEQSREMLEKMIIGGIVLLHRASP